VLIGQLSLERPMAAMAGPRSSPDDSHMVKPTDRRPRQSSRRDRVRMLMKFAAASLGGLTQVTIKPG
jgi:hypothetical protein